MGFAGFGHTQLRYDTIDLARSAEEAKRLVKCANIYHRGQELAWDGRDVLGELIERHGGIQLAADKRRALERIFNIILWGELAAWKISAQLADRLVPLEAKMAATSQAFDEARHFYVMHDYLTALGMTPTRLDRAPQALLDLVLDQQDLAGKLLGMQLLIETMALSIFQSVRELAVEPVLTELLRYFERDEARHVGLGMQYLPSLMAQMSRRQAARLLAFQAHVMAWALAEMRVLRGDFEALGIEPRFIIDRVRQKQLAGLNGAYQVLGWDITKDRNPAVMTLNAAIEACFPQAGTSGLKDRAVGVWRAFWQRLEAVDPEELRVHTAHPIRTARGSVDPGEPPLQ